MRKLLKRFVRLRDEISRADWIPFSVKLSLDLLKRPGYGYGTYFAALQAKALGIPKISAIEFGVAGGYGLIALEEIASEVEKIVGVDVDVFGFDTGSGMPAPEDYRDMPYIWKKGFFQMDVEALRRRLSKAELVLGDVGESVGRFGKSRIGPIGFISFDLDFYSSTKRAFQLLGGSHGLFLPRVYCYFDDVLGDDWEMHTEFTGELLAINEFNAEHRTRKISKINGFRYKRLMSAPWNEKMYIFQIFDHPLQCVHVNPRRKWQLGLR